MKTTYTNGAVDTNASKSKAFTILANGKAFKVLIDGLYANKIQSITREIWSNALDSHVEAGCADKPFMVSFPSTFYPTFSVRDYGVGLSHDDVMEMYTTVFKSTKEDTNEQVGKLGLGSKSPFAYTDTFTVTSITNGVKRFYAAVIAEDGIPTINFMGEENTDEPRGVEVSFPVHAEDVNAFRKAAQKVARGFDVQPVTDDSEDFVGWTEHDVAYSGKNWTYYQEQSTYYNTENKAYAKMGCVLYPIDVDAMPNLDDAQRSMLNSHIVMDFDIGDLEITASREALSYGTNEPTTKSIIKVIDHVIDTMADNILASYGTFDTYWEACCAFSSDMNNNVLPAAVKGVVKNFAMYDGRPLIASLSTADMGMGTNVCLMDSKKIRRVKHVFKYDERAWGSASYAPMSKHTMFLVQDCTTDKRVIRISDRIKTLIRDAEINPTRVVWVQVWDQVGMDSLAELKTKLDGAVFHDINSVELPKSAPVFRSPVSIREMDNKKGTFKEKAYSTDLILEEGGYYVPLTRMEPARTAAGSSPRVVREALIECDVISEYVTIYGVPKSLQKELDPTLWINIYDLAGEAVDKFARGKNGDLTRQRAALLIKHSNLFRIALACSGQIDKKSDMYDVCLLAETVSGVDSRRVRTFSKLEGTLRSVSYDSHVLLEDKKAMDDIVAINYPMLSVLSNHTANPGVDMVVEYVNSQDNNRINAAYKAVA